MKNDPLTSQVVGSNAEGASRPFYGDAAWSRTFEHPLSLASPPASTPRRKSESQVSRGTSSQTAVAGMRTRSVRAERISLSLPPSDRGLNIPSSDWRSLHAVDSHGKRPQ